MFLRFTFAVKVFAIAFSFANGQISEQDDTVQLIDETKVASCVFDNIHADNKHTWDLEFEGFSNHGEFAMDSDSKPVYCFYSTQTDDKRPDNQDEIDERAENEGKIMSINELDPVKNQLDNKNI